MKQPTDTHAAAATLAGLRRNEAMMRNGQRHRLIAALDWANQHTTDTECDAATVGDSPVLLAGDGTPMVESFSIHELSTTLGWSQHATQALVADVLELAYRLPRVWAGVLDGHLSASKARMIASQTQDLSMTAAGFVDDQIAGFAAKTTAAELERLIADAQARFDPAAAAQRAADSLDRRRVDFDHRNVSFTGTTRMEAELDLADALDLDQRISDEAALLKALGSEDSLDGRRATALANLGKGTQRALGFPDTEVSASSTDGGGTHGGDRGRRELVLHVHFPADVLTGDSVIGLVEQGGRRLIHADQIRAWCGQELSRITVRPVIDLNTTYTSPGYAPSPKLRQQVELRDRSCVFPFCSAPARSCDLDHIEPFDSDGPPGQTTTTNLACLCRAHHRAKTHPGAHGVWGYRMLAPGTYLWTSPFGHTYLRDPAGTLDLTPDPVTPPDQ